MTLLHKLKQASISAIQELFPSQAFEHSLFTINVTKPEFKGDYTLVLFPFVKLLKQKPDALGKLLGEHLIQHTDYLTSYEIVSGFLNFTVGDNYWEQFLFQNYNYPDFGYKTPTHQKIMIEYSSPNTNKPLHFGHLRNNFLGAAVANILKATGNSVIKANLINDRGIHICKSMIAWQKFGNNTTPQQTGIKGDHFVGDYYVKFNDVYKQEIAHLIATGADEKTAEKTAPLMQEAQEMLRKWEAGDEYIFQLWQTMNAWVYQGFETTYNRLGITFDKMYYESNTYLLGKKIVEEGLFKGILFKKDDNSVWIDLKEEGLDEKLLLRGDGTSVYITQDLGTAKLKFDEFNTNQSIYVIGDEQNYHMSILKLILKKLGEPCAEGIYHLSYGMVELPTGKMKSREGTVVDADDMIDEMIRLAKEQTELAGKTEGFTEEELKILYETIGLGALKFYLLRVEPKKKMIFNPKESIDLHGFTATFIQYAYTRICSILRKENISIIENINLVPNLKLTSTIEPLEKKMISLMEQYPNLLQNAVIELNPSELCIYAFNLAQTFNSFYDVHSIAKAENEEKKQLRITIIIMAKNILKQVMGILGIDMPDRM